MSDAAAEIGYLLSTAAVRERCGNILAAVEAGLSNFFDVDRTQINACARRVVAVTLQRYPDLNIPYHSRWRHFEAGGVDRYAQFTDRFNEEQLLRTREQQRLPLQTKTPDAVTERARTEIDLALVSVLLDAGAGATWRYATHDPVTQKRNSLQRSEGLGVASFDLFMNGAFSSDPARRLQADAGGLQKLTDQDLMNGFQVSAANPLVGVAGRVELLQRLGKVLRAQPAIFGPDARPGGLFDSLTQNGRRRSIGAGEILRSLLIGLASIWPANNRLHGQALGDCWPHRLAGGIATTAGWVPIHKLSQWLTYSLLEPFERAGVLITDLDDLTALAEYRNGGLLLDTGVIRWRTPTMAKKAYTPADEAVIEWRALTLALMSPLADAIRAQLKLDATRLPLAKILEGGTWAAGRVLAQELRGGLPPFEIVSDATVF